MILGDHYTFFVFYSCSHVSQVPFWGSIFGVKGWTYTMNITYNYNKFILHVIEYLYK